jgi:hypothetical protein
MHKRISAESEGLMRCGMDCARWDWGCAMLYSRGSEDRELDALHGRGAWDKRLKSHELSGYWLAHGSASVRRVAPKGEGPRIPSRQTEQSVP